MGFSYSGKPAAIEPAAKEVRRPTRRRTAPKGAPRQRCSNGDGRVSKIPNDPPEVLNRTQAIVLARMSDQPIMSGIDWGDVTSRPHAYYLAVCFRRWGYISTRRHPSNGRIVINTITDDGAAALSVAGERFTEACDSIRDALRALDQPL